MLDFLLNYFIDKPSIANIHPPRRCSVCNKLIQRELNGAIQAATSRIDDVKTLEGYIQIYTNTLLDYKRANSARFVSNTALYPVAGKHYCLLMKMRLVFCTVYFGVTRHNNEDCLLSK